MPFNGSGTFSRYTPGTPYVNGTTIDETVVNAEMADLATGLTNCVTRDGQSPATANLPMGGFRHTGVGNATTRAATTYASAADVQDGTLTGLTTIAGTNTITATAAISMTVYATNQYFVLKAAATNTGATTLNLNSIGAKNIFSNGAALTGGEIKSSVSYLVVYDGTQFNLIGSVPVTLTNPGNTVQALTDAAPTTWDASAGAIATWTMGASRTISAPTNLKTGGRYVLIITQDATGGRAVTWNAVFKNSAGSMPQPNQQASAVTAFTFTSPDGTNLRLESNEAMVYLTSGTASNSATLDFTKLTGFSNYLIVFNRILPATDSDILAWRGSTDGGSTWDTGANYAAQYILATGTTVNGASEGTTSALVATAVDNAVEGVSGQMLFTPGTTNFLNGTVWMRNSAASAAQLNTSGGIYNGATTSALRFFYRGGNITSGTIQIYGIRG